MTTLANAAITRGAAVCWRARRGLFGMGVMTTETILFFTDVAVAAIVLAIIAGF